MHNRRHAVKGPRNRTSDPEIQLQCFILGALTLLLSLPLVFWAPPQVWGPWSWGTSVFQEGRRTTGSWPGLGVPCSRCSSSRRGRAEPLPHLYQSFHRFPFLDQTFRFGTSFYFENRAVPDPGFVRRGFRFVFLLPHFCPRAAKLWSRSTTNLHLIRTRDIKAAAPQGRTESDRAPIETKRVSVGVNTEPLLGIGSTSSPTACRTHTTYKIKSFSFPPLGGVPFKWIPRTVVDAGLPGHTGRIFFFGFFWNLAPQMLHYCHLLVQFLNFLFFDPIIFTRLSFSLFITSHV